MGVYPRTAVPLLGMPRACQPSLLRECVGGAAPGEAVKMVRAALLALLLAGCAPHATEAEWRTCWTALTTPERVSDQDAAVQACAAVLGEAAGR